MDVSGPKIKPVICQICLGRVRKNWSLRDATAARSSIRSALRALASTPIEAGGTLSTLAKENMLRLRASVEPKRTAAGITMLRQSNLLHVCPVYGSDLSEGSNECQCGTVIVGDDETFECPACECIVPPQSMECPECRKQVDVL